MTQDQLLAYIEKLPEQFQAIFRFADLFARDAADTLDEEFQIAASIVAVFEERAKLSADAE